MSIYTNRDGQTLATTQELGRGGEGIVYALAGQPDRVAKVYHPTQRTAQRQAKLAAMLARPPRTGGGAQAASHRALAWPTDLLFAADEFAGFVMPRIERSPNIFAIFNPKLRQQRYPQMDRRYLHHIAGNVATALSALHAVGCVMGDVNQKNILVKPNTLVTLVDTDSFQVRDASGIVYRCGVGVPEYTPPELQAQPLDSLDRQPYHDSFGLSVLIFQLLMEGYHPFTGRPLSLALREVDQLSLHCMHAGLFPYHKNNQVQPPTDAPAFTWLHPEIQQLFLQAFVLGHLAPASRPTALAWRQAIQRAEGALLQCRHHPSHWYSSHLSQCPYCQAPRYGLIPAQRHQPRPNVTPVATKAVQPVAPHGSPPWWPVLKQLLAFFYLLLMGSGLLATRPWLLLVILLIGSVVWPPARQRLWPTLWQLCMWLTPYLRTGGRWCIGYWQLRSLQFKAVILATAVLVILLLVTWSPDKPMTPAFKTTHYSPLATPRTSPLPTPISTITSTITSTGTQAAGQNQLALVSPLHTPTDRLSTFASVR